MFWPLQSNSEFLGVPEDSQVPFSGVWVATSHFPQSGVATSMNNFNACHLFFKYTFTYTLNSRYHKSYLMYSQFSSNLLLIWFNKTYGWALMLSILGSKMPQYPHNMFTQIFWWGGLGFVVESQVTKKGFYPLAFLSMAIFRALVTISLHALCYKATCSFFVPPIAKTSSTSTRSLKPTIRLWLEWTWASAPITPTWFDILARFDIRAWFDNEVAMPCPCCSNIGKKRNINKLGPTCCANLPTLNETNV